MPPVAIAYPFGDNADTNAWVVSGLNACGIDPQSAGMDHPLGQDPDRLPALAAGPVGARRRRLRIPVAGSANVYTTQDALRAIAGGAFTAARRTETRPGLAPPAAVIAAGTPVPHLLAIGAGPAT